MVVDPTKVSQIKGLGGQLTAYVSTGTPSAGSVESGPTGPPSVDGSGGGGGGVADVPVTNNIYVDGNRTDSYTPSGSITQPFKTIMAAVNYIASIGQTLDLGGFVSNPFTVYVAAGMYNETIDLSNPALRWLTFVGYGAVIGAPQGLTKTAVQAINNDNLTDANFIGFTFYTGAGQMGQHGWTFSSTTNNTNFGSGASGVGILFTDCSFFSSNQDFYVNNCGNVTFDRCNISVIINVTNCVLLEIKGGVSSINQGSQINVFTTATPAPNGFVATQAQLQNANCIATISVDAQSSFIAQMGSRLRNNITVNGAFTNRDSSISGAITVNSGGTYKEDGGGGHTGSLTLNGTGVYTQTGTYGIGTLKLNGVTFSSGSGSPQNVVNGNPGDVYLNTAGGASTTLWVKESGTGTNTGWVGK